MKKIFFFAIPLALLGAVFFLGGCGNQNSSQSTTPTTNSAATIPTTAPGQTKGAVTIQNFAFSPAEITISKGESVTWTNEDSAPHQIASDTNVFSGNLIAKGQNYSFIFKDAGTFSYHCVIHPSMKGTIIVK